MKLSIETFASLYYTCQLFPRYKHEIFVLAECREFWRRHDHFRKSPKTSKVFRSLRMRINPSSLPVLFTSKIRDREEGIGRFPFTTNFGKFLMGILGIPVWEESIPFVTSPIRLQAPLCRFTKKTRCLGKLFCYFLELVFVPRFPVKLVLIIGMCGYEKSGICMFPSF